MLGGVVTAVILAALGLFGSGVRMNFRVETIESKIGELKSDIKDNKDDLSEQLDDIKNEFNTEITSTESRLTEDIKEAKDDFRIAINFVRCRPTQNAKSHMPDWNLDMGDNRVSNSNPNWTAQKLVATDMDTGVKYFSKDLINKRILMPYKEGGEEIYFFGQFNADNHWDGDCTINVYRDDQLVLITDAVYDDGKLRKYKQALPDTNSDGDSIWVIADRVCRGKVNKGTSIRYYRKELPEKEFGLKSVDVKDIISVRQLQATLRDGIEGYYSGNTSNGQYNDKTGKAYFVRYFKDGSVKLLYRGNFEDGCFNDDSWKAWYIVREVNTDYMHYKGPFADNTAKYNDPRYYDFHLDREQINKIIEDYVFACPLKWNFGKVAD